MKLIFVLSSLYIIAGCEFRSYNGFKVYELLPEDHQHLNFITSLAQNHNFDFWSLPQLAGLPAIVMIPPEKQRQFFVALNETNIPYSVVIEDLDGVLRSEQYWQNQVEDPPKGKINFEKYHRYNTIQDYLLRLAEDYPNLISIEDIGNSYERRKMRLVKISGGGKDKPAIFIDGGIHAREWISPAVVLYLIQQLVENKDNRYMSEHVDWYILPILNPDGYEYTHTKERMWRKSRAPNPGYPIKCVGTDLNRNFNFEWSHSGWYGDPCTVVFSGASPFDQRETQALRDFVMGNARNIELYITVHSYGKMILYPWGYTKNLPDNAEELQELGMSVKEAIANVSGTQLTVSSIARHPIIGKTFGSSVDWMRGVAGVNLSYAIELPGQGFDLPASQIISVCVEIFEGFRAYHSYIQKKFKT